MKSYMREATSRNPFVLVLNRGGKYIEVKRRFRTLDDAYDYGNIQMQSFFANGKQKADGYCVINWDEYKIEGYEGDFPTSGVFAKDLYANSPTFTTYTIYPNGIRSTQNESKRSCNNMKLRTNESALQESYVSKLIAKMNIFGYNFVRSPYDKEILEFEDANGSVRQFYDWDEVEDFVSQLTSQKKRCMQNLMRRESKSSCDDMKLRINESDLREGYVSDDPRVNILLDYHFIPDNGWSAAETPNIDRYMDTEFSIRFYCTVDLDEGVAWIEWNPDGNTRPTKYKFPCKTEEDVWNLLRWIAEADQSNPKRNSLAWRLIVDALNDYGFYSSDVAGYNDPKNTDYIAYDDKYDTIVIDLNTLSAYVNGEDYDLFDGLEEVGIIK